MAMDNGGNIIVVYAYTSGVFAKRFDGCEEDSVASKSELPPTSEGIVDDALVFKAKVTIYPNPFADYVNIAYNLRDGAMVKLWVYDLNFRLIKYMEINRSTKGNYTMQWDGTSFSGAPVANGVYIIQLEAGDLTSSSRVLYAKE